MSSAVFFLKPKRSIQGTDFAGRIVFNDKDQEVFNFGKYKGQTVESVLEKDQGYFR